MDKVTVATESDLGPSSGELLGAVYAARRRKVIFGAFGGLVLIGAGVAGLVYYQQKKAEKQTNEALGALSVCLFGDAGPGETPALSFRKNQLGAMGLAEKDRGQSDGAAWPQHCGTEAQTFIDRAKDAGLVASGNKDVGYWADQLSKRIKAPTAQLADASEAIDATFAEAKKAGLKIAPGVKAAAPPGQSAPLTVDDLTKDGTPLTKTPFLLDDMQFESEILEEPNALVQDASLSPPVFVCKFASAGTSCAKVPESITKAGHGLSLLGSTDPTAAPLVFEGNRGDSGIYRSDTGEKVDSISSYGAFSSKDGAAFVFGWVQGEGKAYVIRQTRGAKAQREELSSKDDDHSYSSGQVIWDQLILRGSNKDNQGQVYTRSIDRKSGTLGDLKILDPDDEMLANSGLAGAKAIEACRSGETITLKYEGAVSYFSEGVWTKPLHVPPMSHIQSCNGPSFSSSFIDSGWEKKAWGGSVRTVVCTSAKCDAASTPVQKLIPGGLELAPREEMIVSGPVGDKIAVIWAAGERGGVRMRIGSPRELESQRDIVLFDDLVEGGKIAAASTLKAIRLIPSKDHGVLLLSTSAGVFALRIDASGSVSPEKVSWQ